MMLYSMYIILIIMAYGFTVSRQKENDAFQPKVVVSLYIIVAYTLSSDDDDLGAVGVGVGEVDEGGGGFVFVDTAEGKIGFAELDGLV